MDRNLVSKSDMEAFGIAQEISYEICLYDYFVYGRTAVRPYVECNHSSSGLDITLFIGKRAKQLCQDKISAPNSSSSRTCYIYTEEVFLTKAINV
jgi:hypothetical protein